MKEILEKVLEEYLKFYENKFPCGLCSIGVWFLTAEENRQFRLYIRRNLINSRKRFYWMDGTTTTDSGMWVWPKEDKKSRVNWLKKHIKSNP